MNDLCRACGGACCRVHLWDTADMGAADRAHFAASGVDIGAFIAWPRRCRHQTPDGLCRIYDHRPQPCADMHVGGFLCALCRRVEPRLRAFLKGVA